MGELIEQGAREPVATLLDGAMRLRPPEHWDFCAECQAELERA